jgi:hypothetical protein
VATIVEFEDTVLGFRGDIVPFEVIVTFVQGNATLKSDIVARCVFSQWWEIGVVIATEIFVGEYPDRG